MTREVRLAAGLLTLATAARLAIAARLPLIDDEAYYWTWSTDLAAGYYDHPPAIAWIIAAGTAAFGKTALGVRAGGILLTWVGSIALLPLARSPLLLAAILATMPLFALGGLLATPDVPLLAGWMLALAGLGRLGGVGGGPRAEWRTSVLPVLLAAVGGALAALGKYTAWGFWPLALGAAVLSREWSRVLGTGAACFLSLLLTVPNLRWEADHDWVSVRFQMHHGLSTTAPPGLGGALEFLGAQLGLASPVLLVVGVIAASHPVAPADRAVNWLARLTSLPVLGFFTFAASRSRPEVNWAAPAFVGFALLLAGPVQPRVARAAWLGVGVASSLSGLVLIHAFHPFLRVPGDPVARLGQGEQMAASVRAWGVPVVWCTRYQEAALTRWYDPTDSMIVTTVPDADREDQFDLWRQQDGEGVRRAEPRLFVRPYRSGEPTVIDDLCDRGGPNLVSEHDAEGRITAKWQVYEVTGCRQ